MDPRMPPPAARRSRHEFSEKAAYEHVHDQHNHYDQHDQYDQYNQYDLHQHDLHQHDLHQQAVYHHHVPSTQRSSKASSNSRAHDSVISYPRSPNVLTPSPPSPVSSLASTHARKHSSAHRHPPSRNSIASVSLPPRAYIDPEKAASSSYRSHTPTHVSRSIPDATHQTLVYDDYDTKAPEDRPVQLLLFFSLPCALLSLFVALWTFFALLVALFLQPFRLFTTRPTLSAQLTTFLAPALNLQLRLIYSLHTSIEYSAPMLVVVHLFAPFVSIGLAIAAWTAAFFWFFSAILGDPAGQDGRNDGKECILGVRNWWDRWLARALR